MNYSAFPPAEIRALIRAGKLDAPTTGCCNGYAQGNLAVSYTHLTLPTT